MREIIVRGIDADGVWCHGYLSKDSEGSYRIQSTDRWDDVSYPIIPETVGQSTGLKDRNGKDIYEGDIVRWDDKSDGEYWRFAVVKIDPDIQFDCEPIPLADGIENSSRSCFDFGSFCYKDTSTYLEVIGNIFENKELIEKKYDRNRINLPGEERANRKD